MEFRSKGTLLLRWKGQVYKILAVRSPGKNIYRFQRLNIKTDKNPAFAIADMVRVTTMTATGSTET
jgi:hypothetical protein